MTRSEELKKEIEILEITLFHAKAGVKKHEGAIDRLNGSITEIESWLKDKNKELKQALRDEAPQEDILLKKIASIRQLLHQNKYTIERQEERVENARLNLIGSQQKLMAKEEHRERLIKDLEAAELELNEVSNAKED